MTIPNAESQPGPPSLDNLILTYSCSAVCNACGQSFNLKIRDENQEQALANFFTVILPRHGSVGGGGIPICPNGGGKSADDYSQIEAIKI